MAIKEEDTDYTIETSARSLEDLGFVGICQEDYRFQTSYGMVIIKQDSNKEFRLYNNGCFVGRHLKYINHVKDIMTALYAEEY